MATLRDIIFGSGMVGADSYLNGLSVGGIDIEATVARKGVPLPSSPIVEGLIRVGAMLRSQPSQKIGAIKEIRAMFGFGLKESKDIIDAILPPGYIVTKDPNPPRYY